MSTTSKFQKIDAYMSALCIGAAATVSFWFLIIGVVLGLTDSPQEKASFHPHPYAMDRTYDANPLPKNLARYTVFSLS